MTLPGYIKTVDGIRHELAGGRLPLECFRCGICCERYQPRVTAAEIADIARYIGLTKREFFPRYIVKAPIKEGYLIKMTNLGCCFLHYEKEYGRAACIIHMVRPRTCRDWTASLSRPECRQGLARIRPEILLLKAGELYSSRESKASLIKAVAKRKKR